MTFSSTCDNWLVYIWMKFLRHSNFTKERVSTGYFVILLLLGVGNVIVILVRRFSSGWSKVFVATWTLSDCHTGRCLHLISGQWTGPASGDKSNQPGTCLHRHFTGRSGLHLCTHDTHTRTLPNWKVPACTHTQLILPSFFPGKSLNWTPLPAGPCSVPQHRREPRERSCLRSSNWH